MRYVWTIPASPRWGGHPDDTGEGLWTEIQGLVQNRAGALRVQHIAAHRDGWKEDDPVDAWTAEWNDRADREAGAAQFLRGRNFLESRQKLVDEHHKMRMVLQQLQKLHMEISNFRLHAKRPDDEEVGDQDAALRVWWHGRLLHADASWQGRFDPNWLAHLPGSDLAGTFGMKFSRAMPLWLQEQNMEENGRTTRWTWLEIAVCWLWNFADKLLMPTTNGCWEDSPRGSRHCPTVAATVHLVRRFFHQLDAFLGCEVNFCNGQSLLPLAVRPP